MVFHRAHFGDEVGGFDQRRLGIAAGDDHVEVGATGLQS
jgi:hypothetical protein